MSYGGECGRGWVGVDQWRGAIVLVVFRRVSLGIGELRNSSSSVWDKSTVGRAIVSSSPSETSFVVSSFLMCPTRPGVLDGLVGEFLADST